jgi:hypothetical protein
VKSSVHSASPHLKDGGVRLDRPLVETLARN